MALELQTILSTDTFEAGRVITNANFSIVLNQLNQILDYLDSDFGTFTGLTNIETSELKVDSNKLVVSPSEFVINDNVELNGNLTLNGNLIRGNVYSTSINNSLQEVIDNGGEYNIGSISSYPNYTTYKVSSSHTAGLTLNLFPGAQGQELFFIFVNDPVGTETYVAIQKSTSGTAEFYLPSGTSIARLDAVGETIHLKYIDDGWFIAGGNGFTTE